MCAQAPWAPWGAWVESFVGRGFPVATGGVGLRAARDAGSGSGSGRNGGGGSCGGSGDATSSDGLGAGKEVRSRLLGGCGLYSPALAARRRFLGLEESTIRQSAPP